MSAEEFLDLTIGPKNYSISPFCHWKDVFNNEERRFYHAGLFWTCVVSVLAMMWLNMALIKTSLWQDYSYRYLTLYTVPAGMRRFLIVLSSFFNQTIMSSCVFFAYVDSLFGMLEIEGLTHACISRFVMATCAIKGRPMDRRHWQLFIIIATAFAVFYTFLPLTGYGGSYHYDFTCTTCSFNMILPRTPERNDIMFFFFLRYLKPSLMMFAMLIWASYLEKYVCKDDGNAARKKFTCMMVEVVGAFSEWCGLLVVIRFLVIVNQICDYYYEEINLFIANGEIWIEWANWLHALSPIGVFFVLVWRDEKILYHMFNLRSVKAAADPGKKEEKEIPATQKQENKDTDKIILKATNPPTINAVI